MCNSSPGALVSVNYIAGSVYQCLIFVHSESRILAYLGLRSILVLCKQAQIGEYKVLENAYHHV